MTATDITWGINCYKINLEICNSSKINGRNPYKHRKVTVILYILRTVIHNHMGIIKARRNNLLVSDSINKLSKIIIIIIVTLSIMHKIIGKYAELV